MCIVQYSVSLGYVYCTIQYALTMYVQHSMKLHNAGVLLFEPSIGTLIGSRGGS